MKYLLGIVLSIVVSLWVLIPLGKPGYFPMHDDTQIARVIVMGRALRQGQFPVRWVSDLGYGYGYPIFNFYSPLPYYIGGGFYALGIDNVTATKMMFAVGILLGSLFCFIFLQPFLGTLAALTGSILFAYAPYHAVQLYIRGSVGEYWALAFIPLYLHGIMSFSKNNKKMGVIVGSIGLAGIILSHTILSFLCLLYTIIAICIWWIFVKTNTPKAKKIYELTSIIILGLGLSCFFWLPAFIEMRYTGVASMISQASSGFFDHFVCIGQLWNSPWGYGGSAPGCLSDGMSFKLGKFQLLLFGLGACIWMYRRKMNVRKPSEPVMILSITVFIVSVLSMLDISEFIWRFIPFVSFIQYPWRLLSFASIAMAISGSYVVSVFKNRILKAVFAAIIILSCIFINIKLFQPQYMYALAPADAENNTDIQYRVSKISDEYLPDGIDKPTNLNEVPTRIIEGSESLKETEILRSDTHSIVRLVSKAGQRIIIHRAYFPGWNYLLNGKHITFELVSGLPSIQIPEGESTLELQFTNTGIRLIANSLSILSFCTVVIILLYGKKTIS